MKRPGFLSLLALAIVTASMLLPAGAVARAEPLLPGQIIVLVADGQALRESEEGLALTRSLIGLVATLQDGHLFAFINGDDPNDVLGPVRLSAHDLNILQEEIAGRLMWPKATQGGALDDALLEAYSLLVAQRAAAGSTVYVLTGASADGVSRGMTDRGSMLGARFTQSGWVVNGLTLPGTPAEAVGFLEALSAAAGGRVSELSVDDGFKQLADTLLSQGAKGTLNAVGRSELTLTELMTAVVGVVPGTRETTLILFRESPYGSLRLGNPSGLEVSAGDRTSSYVVETPNVVIWKLLDPAPGNWTIEARQTEGLVTAWEYSSNGYTLVLRSSTTAPIGRPGVLSAFVRKDGQRVVLDDVRLFASVTTPYGVTSVYELRDDGAVGDAEAGDGYFSTLLPPLRAEGKHRVELDLRWTGYDHRISSTASFEARAYPALEVRPGQLTDLPLKERTKVAEVFVHIQGEPYLVDADQLTVLVNSSSDAEAAIEIEPRRLFGEGPAWEYEVYLTPRNEGNYAVAFTLSLDYAGRAYSYSSDAIVLSAKAPPSPSELMVVSSAPVEPVSPAPTVEPFPPALPVTVEPSGFPMWVLAFSAALLVIVAAGAAYLLTRTRPYGYLYNDRHEPLVDFSKVKRHPVLGLVFRSSVRGRELNVPGLEDVVFHFTKARIKIRNLRDRPTIRVNSQPLVGDATIQHRTWLGARGKLYTFMLSRSSLQEGAGAD